MKTYFKYLLLYFAWLLLIFNIARFFFLLYTVDAWLNEKPALVLHSYWVGAGLDISAACYILLPVVLLSMLQVLKPSKILSSLLLGYHLLIQIIFWSIAFTEMPLFAEWGIKMHYKALVMVLKFTRDAYNAATPALIIGSIAFIALTVFSCHFFYKRFIHKYIATPEVKKQHLAVVILVLPVLMLIGIRGGLQEIPVQISRANYCHNNTLNNAAANSVWHLGNSTFYGIKYNTGHPYKLMPDNEAKQIFESLNKYPTDSSVQILSTPKPNIVLVILESVSAEALGCINKNTQQNLTPNLNNLAQNGILFSRCYASGERSDQGVAAVLTGYPALPLAAVSNLPEKINNIPGLPLQLSKNGYSSLFVYGGELEYGNIRSLLYQQKINKIISEKDLDKGLYRGRLGVHDENIFPILLNEINTLQQPFFAGTFNISTHFNFDYPKPKQNIAWAGKHNNYLNAIEYTDSCIGVFLNEAASKPWYNNTLFVFVSDHSAHSPWSEDFKSKEHHHIPLIFYGNVIKPEYRGTDISKTVSQQDMCLTVLNQLGLHINDLTFSKDILNPTCPSYAYYTFTEGLGWVENDNTWYMEDLMLKYHKNSTNGFDTSILQKRGRAYLQMLYNDYLLR